MLRLMTFNIQEGGGSAGRLEQILAVILRADPDLLVLNEAVGWFPKHTMADRLARLLGAEYRIAASSSGFDVAFFSRLPILGFHQPRIANLFHTLAWTEVALPGGSPMNLIGAHLDYREESLRVLEIKNALPHLAPLVNTHAAILGDLNALSPDDPVMGLRPDELAQTDLSEMPEWFLNRYPPRTLGMLYEAGWVDAYRQTHAGETGYTMSTSDPNARYDYILVSPSLAEKTVDVHVETESPASTASDHFAVVADLAV